MRGLILLLKFKIAATAVLWCLPLLVFPAGVFVQLGFPAPVPLLFARLLGAAYLTMLVGYVMALQQSKAGEVPHGTILTGIVSNSLAFLVFLSGAATGAWSSWGQGAQIFMWLSTIGALCIALLLGYFKKTLATSPSA